MEPRQQFSLWYLLLAVTTVLILQSFIPSSHVESLPYSDFKVLLKAGKLKNISLGEGVITGTLSTDGIESLLPKQEVEKMLSQGKGDHSFSTLRVNDPSLVQDLEAAKVRFVGQADNKWIGTLLSWLVPAILFFAVWSFLIKRVGSAAGGGNGDWQEQSQGLHAKGNRRDICGCRRH